MHKVFAGIQDLGFGMLGLVKFQGLVILGYIGSYSILWTGIMERNIGTTILGFRLGGFGILRAFTCVLNLSNYWCDMPARNSCRKTLMPCVWM